MFETGIPEGVDFGREDEIIEMESMDRMGRKPELDLIPIMQENIGVMPLGFSDSSHRIDEVERFEKILKLVIFDNLRFIPPLPSLHDAEVAIDFFG